MKWPRVQVDDYFLPTSQDNMLQLRHALGDPRNDHVLKDDNIHFIKENPETCLAVDDIPFAFNYDLKTDRGGLDFITRRITNDSRLEVCGRVQPKFVKNGGFDARNGTSIACEGYLSDVETAERKSVSKYGSCTESRLGSNSQGNSHGLIGSDIGIVNVGDLSTGTCPVPKLQSTEIDRGTTFESVGTSMSKCEVERPVNFQRTSTLLKDGLNFEERKDGVYDSISENKACTFGRPVNLQSTPNLVKDGLNFNEKEDMVYNSISGNKACGFRSAQHKKVNQGSLALRDAPKKLSLDTSGSGKFSDQKRSRKPPRRFIDEYSNQKSKCAEGKGKLTSTTTRKKTLATRSQNEHQHVTFGVLTLASGRGPISGASNQAPCDFQLKGEIPNKSPSTPELSSSGEATDSGDDHVMIKRAEGSGDRRKNQHMWTPSEVVDLVDGISQYGVGKWTDIKRLLFSSSDYRTPIDLRDKWRNLIKSSRAQLKRGKQENQKTNSQKLPASLLERVIELAAENPYPRYKSKSSRGSSGDELAAHPSHHKSKKSQRNCASELVAEHSYLGHSNVLHNSHASEVAAEHPYSGRKSNITQKIDANDHAMRRPYLETEFSNVSDSTEYEPGRRIRVRLQ